MPKYEVLEKSFIDNHIVEVGAVIEFDGLPAPQPEAAGC